MGKSLPLIPRNVYDFFSCWRYLFWVRLAFYLASLLCLCRCALILSKYRGTSHAHPQITRRANTHTHSRYYLCRRPGEPYFCQFNDLLSPVRLFCRPSIRVHCVCVFPAPTQCNRNANTHLAQRGENHPAPFQSSRRARVCCINLMAKYGPSGMVARDRRLACICFLCVYISYVVVRRGIVSVVFHKYVHACCDFYALRRRSTTRFDQEHRYRCTAFVYVVLAKHHGTHTEFG